MTWTPTRPSAALRAGAAVAVIAASAALMLSACSSSSGSSGSAADAKPSGSVTPAASSSGRGGANGQAMEAYRNCLTQHGVNMPTFNRPSGSARPSGRPSGRPGGGFGGGGFGGGGFPGMGGASPDAATQKALDACKSLRPQFNGQRGGAGGAGGADSSAYKAFTSCLKDHGVTLPSPTASGARGGGFRGGLNTADPKTAKAYSTCKVLLPQRPSASASPSA